MTFSKVTADERAEVSLRPAVAHFSMIADQAIPFFDSAFLEAAGFSLRDVGYAATVDKEPHADNRLTSPFRNEFFIVSFVTQGWLTMKINFLEYTIAKGQIVFLLPQTVFEMVESSTDLRSSTLLVDRAFLGSSGLHAHGKEVSEFMASDHNVLQLTDHECKVLNALLYVLQHEGDHKEASLLRKDIARHVFLAFMYELSTLYRQYKVDIRPTISRKEELTMRFIQMVSAHFREERSVQYYADHLFVTAKYLSTAIKEITQKSPGAFIDDAVVAEAKILLTNPAAGVAEIAETLNFSDQSFFGKYFKKHTGFAPSDYRQQYWAS